MNFLNNFIDLKVKKNMGMVGFTDEFFCACVNKVYSEESRSILIVVNSLFEANKLYTSLCAYNDHVCLFPMDDFLTSEALAISPDLRVNRLETINKIMSEEKVIVIANLMGYLRFLPVEEVYKNCVIDIKVGDFFNPSDLVKKLISDGYTRDTIVNKTGEIGVRGFIIDVFPVDESNPVRIEFFDDEIESIRYFDPDSQKSLSDITSIKIKPYFEFLTSKDVEEEEFGKQKFLPKYEKVTNILGYLGDAITFFKDYEQLKLSYNNIMDEVATYRMEKDVDFTSDYMFNFNDVLVNFPIFYMSINNVSASSISMLIDFKVKPIANFMENIENINKFIRKCLEEDKTIVICLKKYQLKSIVKKLNVPVHEVIDQDIKNNKVNLIEGEINQGFIYNNLVLLTAAELFNVQEKKKKYVTKYKYSMTIKDVSKLEIGDYVVHNIHGIGVYNGIKTLKLNDVSKDYLEVLYQGTDKIYIPVEKIDLLTKYSGKDGVAPKINKLGSNDWSKTKSRVKAKVKDVAEQLLKLYAERERKVGFAFSKDNDMLIDFENDFPYELTPDQKKAIAVIKEDMEKAIPMDRLLCGDVGFGKTEVAFVAAFKAILDSKQVLFLCPTTILSNQHYENAKERFKNFPVSIGILNRFTTPKERRRVLDGLNDGTIDLVFGTHRLLSDDVKVKDLGLLVIDEEQRFGVMHKEKIKQYKTNVDVLTLTATPIPRTLQMSLVGIRSLSLIETPPMNRYPVQTYVVEENKQILKDAIYKELARDGQVFVLYNRVQSIEEEAIKVKNLVPEAKITVVHGQMTKIDLESRIFDFINHEYDILLCTTIIETGIDIPNVNTLIIMDADRFGLSQLYQIRGRVGRSDKFAYAYLMYEPHKMLTETAIKRLNVIKNFTELGSGFSIATRDLSIRGAGDILGSEQAGFIDSVGVDLYLKMLNDEVNKEKSIENSSENIKEDETNSQPLLNVTTHIEDSYVFEDELKIDIHRMINEVEDEKSFNKVKDELEDRFGKVNEDIIIYMYEEWFEKLADKLQIKKVNQTKNSIELTFIPEVAKKFDMEEVFMDAYYVSNMFRFISKNESLIVVLDIIKLEKHPVFYLVSFLDTIYKKFGNKLD